MPKVLYFITTEEAGRIKSGISYLSKYPDTFLNVSIHPVAHNLVMSKLSGYVHEVDSHTKYRQSDLALENYWVTQCGWLWLCMTVSMGNTITNLWKIFSYWVKIYHG